MTEVVQHFSVILVIFSPKSLVPALTVERRKDEQKESIPLLPPNPLTVQRVYHKLVHDKWVVGVNVVNDGEQ